MKHGKLCPCCCADWGLLLVRLALAVVFIAHGAQKLQNMDMVVGFMGGMGIPAALAWVAALGELLGGIAMLLGVFTKYAGAVLAFIMAIAIWKVKSKAGFFGGWEFDLVLLLISLAVISTGPGKFSVCWGHTCGDECKNGCKMK